MLFKFKMADNDDTSSCSSDSSEDLNPLEIWHPVPD